jgi:diguanylate cyclase (GGDEF)-like protein
MLTLVLFFALIFVNFRKNINEDDYYDLMIEEYNTEIATTLESYSRFSSYIFESLITNDDYILSTVNEAYTADATQQDILRQDLYDYLIEDYGYMVDYDFRQFQFIFPDSTSFLRVHSPSRYGDSLYDVRYSIRTVNEYERIERGFEEGRTFNGYRYVYPLSYSDQHIGAIEISISLSSVINVLSELHNNDYCFIIDKEIVDSIVFGENMSNYTESFISSDFYTDISCFSDIDNRNLIPQAEFEEFFSGFNDDDLKGLDTYEDFGLIHKYEGEDYEVLFSSINNIEGIKIGYFISIHEEEGISLIGDLFTIYNILIFTLYIIFSLIGVYIVRGRLLLKGLSNTDRLTGLDNRRKFEIDVNREIGRSKRSNFPLSFIMFDIDKFKEINDTYGHHTGDIVLRELSSLVGSLIRREDYLSRYGGEEFIIMLVGSNEIDAYNKAENLRKVVEQYSFSFEGKIRISLGVFEHSIDGEEFETIMEKVDKAMYQAKETGRNKAVKYSNIKTP